MMTSKRDPLAAICLDYAPGKEAGPTFRLVPIRMRGDGVQYPALGESVMVSTDEQLLAATRALVADDRQERDRIT